MQAHFLISLNVWFQTKELHVILYGCILLDDNNTPLLYVYILVLLLLYYYYSALTQLIFELNLNHCENTEVF